MVPKDVNDRPLNSISAAQDADGIEIIFYTDPLCCWSWAIRPQWGQLLSSLDPPVKVSYRMAGLLPSWKHFNDTLNSICKPVQMGPEWMHARAVSGVDFDDRIWITDAPASSFPACIAVKAAQLQSPHAGEKYLYYVQKAVMTECRNIARQEVLLDIAAKVHAADAAFDIPTFRKDLYGEKARNDFRKDIQECKYLNITRLPTIIFKINHRATAVISGYQSWEDLTATVKKIVPG